MRLDRLLAMTMILINRKRVRAQELAEMFAVSIRTIYRDIDTLSQAGIPVITYQGTNGGIGLVEGYRLDKSVLTEEELHAISSALKSVSTSFDDIHTTKVIEKIKNISGNPSPETFFVDFSPWGGNPQLKDKITLIKAAIHSSLCIQFTYTNSGRVETIRKIEPHTIVLKGQSWYIYGFCLLRNQFRLFKISRIKELVMSEKEFERREVQLENSPWDKEWYHPEKTVTLKIRFDHTFKPTMEEIFSPERFVCFKDGICQIEIEMPEDNWMYGFLLSFMDEIEVMGPGHVRQKLKELSMKMMNKYR
ncbi:helix-turn-helix transcriptional regulator [Lederbergia lenta]|uniref:DNA-binding protein n=1 Tax=Lederbergia lenta TaxID=1467 RepID=A0A2X4W940_LEDLE|nr:YafY family protein [Lederbergia lenta]MEC2323862.1 YafY family protein [Lederbergia lenta]SQI61177.1 DNA-binding protein [Lederbergia lenta]